MGANKERKKKKGEGKGLSDLSVDFVSFFFAGFGYIHVSLVMP